MRLRVMCVSRRGEGIGASRLSPQSTFHPRGEGQAAREGKVRRHLSVYVARPLCCLLDPRANAEA